MLEPDNENAKESHWKAPPYISNRFRRTVDVLSVAASVIDLTASRRTFRPLVTVSGCAFPVAATKVNDSLPDDVSAAPTLFQFRRL
jgi:hypothetical protein